MDTTILTTARLTLRLFTMDDIEELFAITNEADIFRYFPTRTGWTVEKTERSIFHQTQHWEKFGYGQMAVTLTESGQLMGWCGLEFLPETNETEVGYLLSKSFWGLGYATEASKESVRFGVEKAGLREIIGLTDPENVASQKVLQKCGMAFTRRQVYFGMEMFRFAIQA
ncbi:MAG: GNAT family N-acetyltransferase [Chloroflexi bacterium]|jgi:RimJ/RimL family protein N-acetyltransferase|nr:GNAT family N-acetyltransferase [Chloroflexota bacterium]